jgi:hypothetical protein
LGKQLFMIKIVITIILSFFLLNATNSSVNAESTEGTLPHATDFLSLPVCGNDCGTTYFPTATSSQRSEYISALISRGYTHAYLSVTSSESGHNFYYNPSGFRSLLQELIDAGIKPVVWLTSDTGSWKDQSISAIKSDLTNFIPIIDSLVNSYEVGLEANEYWSSSEILEIGNHLDSLTDKPLSAHQTPGLWNYCSQSWCDYMILQTNNPSQSITETQIVQAVNNARNSLGKPVVVGEYSLNESGSITLGNAALQNSCAAGCGNGCTPSNILWPVCDNLPTHTPTPTSSINQSPSADNVQVNTSENESVYIQLSFTDPDGPGPYTYTITNSPSNGVLGGSDNDRTYTPNQGFTGTDYFRWKINDGLSDSNIATITIVVEKYLDGDGNIDGIVDGQDFIIWLTHYGQSISGANNGDYDYNNKIEVADFLVWIKNYGY